MRHLVDVNVTMPFNSKHQRKDLSLMPALRSKIKPTSEAFAANAQRMQGLLAEVQRLEGLVLAVGGAVRRPAHGHRPGADRGLLVHA